MGFKIETGYHNGTLSIDITPERNADQYQYAYYLMNFSGDAVEKRGYSKQQHCVFSIPEKGKYRVLYYVMEDQNKYSFLSEYTDCQE